MSRSIWRHQSIKNLH